MKRSIIKKIIIPVIISENELLRPNIVEISPAPFSRKTIMNAVRIIVMGLNFASHETMIAVNPLPSTVFEAIVWFVPLTRSRPAIPQIAPERMRVLIITFLTLIPMYFAVFSLSPTTEIS